ncbi:serine/threonine-protein kinase 11-interacting protein-like isoform X2 [Saccostrea echinata]|uniref:serine/threonine-protein kinase 11-interacting protein-like isoform X2 n=1 Tax=Saccostrea echinata TaxID=191078 RepID=UPI002A82E72B|nr:serine/threonine-protein kinase 11-interacting protein-like isoform X2 [Saccostrea echinata]
MTEAKPGHVHVRDFHNMDKLSPKEFAIVNDLANLLRKNGEQILNGSTQFCLTTQSLGQLNNAFRRYSETKYDFEAKKEVERSRRGSGRSRERTNHEQEQFYRWRTNAQFLNDFITKTASLKITHGTATMQGPILISRFKSLQVLELKKIPTHMLEGLHKLRGQLHVVTVTRCLHTLQEFLETCGGDQSNPMSWPLLTAAYFSYNWISKLDASLRLLPGLHILDLSHNNIDKVESYLEYLTELRRINLGYNMLDSVPTFSITVQSKLKTLVIRNNNLDNLSGVEMLVNLEELDASENCLVDHSCLGVFNKLHSLHVISLQGNPLCYHQHHRIRSLHQMSSKAITTKEVILDGKPVKLAEIMHLQSTGKLSTDKQPEERSSRQSTNNPRLAQSYKFDDTDDIAESVLVGSPSRRKSRKKKFRGRNQRTDTEGSEVTETTDQSSPESSRVPSPTRIVEGQASTREEIEVLRDHYGVNWLQVISAKEYDGSIQVIENDEQKSSLLTSVLDNEKQSNHIQDKTNSKQAYHTEDDIYLNESTADVHYRDDDMEDDIEVLHVSNGSDTIIKTTSSDFSTLSSERPDYNRMNSSKGAEWDRDDEEKLALYGEECEPFIVMLPDADLKVLLVTLNQRYLIEKDIDGKIKEMLDLRCLLSFKIEVEDVTHANLVDEKVPVFRAKFDYMKKDRRERVFIMENTAAANEFEELLRPIVEAKEAENRKKNLLQCLKCSKEVCKQDVDISEHVFDKKDKTAEPGVRYQCPHCGSKMMMEVAQEEKNEVPVSQGAQPSSNGDDMKQEGKKDESELSGSLTRPRTYAFSDVMSHSDIGKILTTPEITRSNSTGKALSEKQKEEESANLINSWSDVKSSEQSQRKSRNSVDSDISLITNPSDASISVISESSVETISEPPQNGDNSYFVTSTPQKQDKGENGNVAVPRSLNLNGIIEEEDMTPVGSPLSNSICSSMVSSMYENSLSINIDNQEYSPQKDTSQTVMNECSDRENNNGDTSIYSQFKTEEESVDNSSSYETCDQNSTQDSITQKVGAVLNGVDEADSSAVMNESGYDWLKNLDNLHHVDLSVVDHKLQLYLDMNVFEESESVQFCIQCSTVQYMRSSEFQSYLIFSTSRILIIEISDPDTGENTDGLSCIENQPITELCYIDIGLGYQSVRLEFDTMCSSYSFLIRDEERCKSFISLVTEIIQDTAFSEESKLEGISKFNADTLCNLQDTVWWKFKHNLTEDDNKFDLVRYLSGTFITENTDDTRSVGLAVTEMYISLVVENHQWPLPRLQSALPEHIKGQQFVLLDRQKINNIASVEVCQSTGAKVKINFFNEESQEEAQWFIAMETSISTRSLLDSIREPWEAAFGVEMEIIPTEFEEVS